MWETVRRGDRETGRQGDGRQEDRRRETGRQGDKKTWRKFWRLENSEHIIANMENSEHLIANMENLYIGDYSKSIFTHYRLRK